MRRAISILIVLLLCVWFLPRSASAGEEKGNKVELGLRFSEGQQLTLTRTVEQDTTRTWNDQARESKETTSTTLALNVVSVGDDGTATIEVTIKAVALKSTGGRTPYEYDSANPPTEVPRPAAPFAAVVGQTFTMKLTPGGKVPGFEGVDALLKAAQDAIPDEGRGRQWRRERLTHTFSEAALRQTMEGVFGFLPDKAVAVGDSWTRTTSTDDGIPVAAEETYTLTKRNEGTATITIEAKLKPQERAEGEGGDAAAGQGPPPVRYDVTGTEKGTITVDEATGCLFKTAITQELEGKTVMSGFRGDNTERSVPIKSKIAVTVETQPEQQEKAAEPEHEPEPKPE
jgi:hypothetical protein